MPTRIERRTLLAAGLATGAAALLAPSRVAARGAAVPTPVIVLVRNDPWAAIIGAEPATFALYLDGTVILRAYNGYRSVVLDDAEMLQLMARLDVEALSHADNFYETTFRSDQPSQSFFVFRGKRFTHIVYGSLDKAEARAAVPAGLVAAYDYMIRFDHPRARTWLPEKIEVMLSPISKAEPTLPWPDGWPGLDDPATIQRNSGQRSVYIPSIHDDARIALVEALGAYGGVTLGGQIWSISGRLPFPAERLWMGPAPST